MAEAARRHGVSPQRIRALIAAGRIRAERVGRDWAVDAASLELLPRAVSRPLSSRMAAALLSLAAGDRPVGLDPAELARLKARMRQLRESPEPAVLLRGWFASLGERRLYVAKDLEFLRDDPRLQPAGLSLPDSGLNDAGVVEAVVAPDDLSQVAVHHMLRPAGLADANVVLHVGGGAHDANMWLVRAVHLAQHADRSGREDAEVARIVEKHA